MRESVFLGLSFLVWVFVFRHFINHDIAVNIDTNSNYALTKFYINNILNGVFPLWDPFLYLGEPFVFIPTGGIFNPFLYLVALLRLSGMDYYSAYIVYLTAYYFIGLLGFYLFAKSFLNDRLAAFIAFLLLLFSGVGASIFNQINMLLMFTPAVWFFFFFIHFVRFFKKSCLLGMTFSCMLIFTSYMPFYFLTVFGLSIICLCLMYRSDLKGFFRHLFIFIKKNTILFLFCLFSVGVALTPILAYKTLSSSGQVVTPSRHCDFVNAEQCYADTIQNNARMPYFQSCSGGLGWRMSFQILFSHLNKFSYAQDALFYLPIFSYILIILGIWTYVEKRMLLLMGVGTVTFFISATDVTPLHRFLFDHIFVFRYFRNLFFFMVFLMPIIVLLSALQFKKIMEYQAGSIKEKNAVLTFLFIAHIAFFLFLAGQGDIITSSYVAIFGSMLLSVLYVAGYFKEKKQYFLAGLFVLCILQPYEVFTAYGRHAAEFKCDLPAQHVYPKFSFSRPNEGIKNACATYRHVPQYKEFYYDMVLSDSTGFIGAPGSVARWSFILSREIDQEIITDYVKDKFILYDRVEPLPDHPEGFAVLSDALKNKRNVAYISTDAPDAGLSLQNNEGVLPKEAFVVSGESENFKVLHFDVNSLKLLTRFHSRKFLVYTDSFNHGWQVFINGRPDNVYRANVAFKGVWLPAGENTVYFKYSPPGGEACYVLMVWFFFLFFAYTLFMLRKEKTFSLSGESP